MIKATATRRFRLNGVEYAKGADVPMPLQQFNDLEPTGLVERAPAEVVEHQDMATKRTVRAKGAVKPKSSASAD